MLRKLKKLFAGPGLAAVLARALTGSAGLRLAGMGLTFLVGVQLARGLGAEGYGIYGLAMAVIAILMVPTEFGLPQLLTREIAAAHTRGDTATIRGVLSWATKVSLGIAFVIAFSMIAWLIFAGDGLASPLGVTLLMGVAMIPVVAQVAMRSAALRGLQQIIKGEYPNVVLRPLFYSLLLFLVPWLFGPMTPAMAMALGVVSAGIALLFAEGMLRKALPSSTTSHQVRLDVRSWWMSALPMAATNGLGVLRGQLLILMMGALLTVADVGQYRIAMSILGLVLFPVSVFSIVSAPYIASLHVAQNPSSIRKVLFMMSAGSAAGVLLMSMPFFIAGDSLIQTVFGHEFASANRVLVVLSTGLFLSNLFGGNVVLLNMTGHHREVMLVSSASLVLLAAIAYFLIDEFGLMGAAIAFVISNISSDLLMWGMANRRLGMGASVFLLPALRRSRGG